MWASAMRVWHRPVLLEEVVSFLAPSPGTTVVDATIGEGGHAEVFLETFPSISLIGVDVDPSVIEVARTRLTRFGDRLTLFNMWYSVFFERYRETLDHEPGVVLFDLGISRFHYESAGRGFSFGRDEPLDMRLAGGVGRTAAEIVNRSPIREIERILMSYGEERWARQIARAVVAHRDREAINSSLRLAEIVRRAVPGGKGRRRLHPATKTFQALRIAVNSEMEQVENGVRAALKVLAPGGKLGVISFHSLEDRIVKGLFRDAIKPCICPAEQPICNCGGRKMYQLMTKKPVPASEEEVRSNPSARSAKLRVIEKMAVGTT